MKFVVIGLGYVGFSLAYLISKNDLVIGVDTNIEKVNLVNQGISPISDIDNNIDIVDFNLRAESNLKNVINDEVDCYIVAVPTNYDEKLRSLDTSIIESVIETISKMHKNSFIVIKSTVPIGFTEKIQEKNPDSNIIFSPEFLREGNAIYDNLYPSRIVVGDKNSSNKWFGNYMWGLSKKDDVYMVSMTSTEAESVKMFSNTYLAMRVAFFNELDSFAELKQMNSKIIIDGVCSDPRIGDYYNNPSFGFGGYCLPKDSKELSKSFEKISANSGSVIKSIQESNLNRINYIVDRIEQIHPKVVGIYKLAMKKGSQNFRESSILYIMKKLKEIGIPSIVYEPQMSFLPKNTSIKVTNDFTIFCNQADVILANRYESELECVKNKLYTRDQFNRD